MVQPDPSKGWVCATPQGRDRTSKMEEFVPKMARQRYSDAVQSF